MSRYKSSKKKSLQTIDQEALGFEANNLPGTSLSSRRQLLKSLLFGLGGAALPSWGQTTAPATKHKQHAEEISSYKVDIQGKKIEFVDLTHTLNSDFNFNPMSPRIVLDPIVGSGYEAGMKLNRLLLNEHTGTHLDAPSHFNQAEQSVGDLSIDMLIVPLAVIDVSKKVATNPNATLDTEDVFLWEQEYGPLPHGCCVAMRCGLNMREQLKTINQNSPKSWPQFPGFSTDTAQLLIHERNVKGIAVESGSLDASRNVPDYPVHKMWLKSGRWGIEGITNLDLIPQSGAWLIVGVAPITGATGFPIRAIAFF